MMSSTQNVENEAKLVETKMCEKIF